MELSFDCFAFRQEYILLIIYHAGRFVTRAMMLEMKSRYFPGYVFFPLIPHQKKIKKVINK
jgi:hypothetical protein